MSGIQGSDGAQVAAAPQGAAARGVAAEAKANSAPSPTTNQPATQGVVVPVPSGGAHDDSAVEALATPRSPLSPGIAVPQLLAGGARGDPGRVSNLLCGQSFADCSNV